MKRLFLFSGGIDSAVALDMLMRELTYLDDPNCPPKLVFFDYGQAAAEQELAAVRYWAGEYDLSWERIVTREYKKLLDSRPECDWVFKGFVPMEASWVHDPDLLVLPGRNLFLLTIAAIKLYDPADTLVQFILGTHLYEEGNDTGDCSRNFLESMEKSLTYGLSTTSSPVRYQVYSPVQNLSKKGILDYAKKMKIDLSKTWTCYQPGNEPCGECRHCRELKREGLL